MNLITSRWASKNVFEGKVKEWGWGWALITFWAFRVIQGGAYWNKYGRPVIPIVGKSASCKALSCIIISPRLVYNDVCFK